MFRITPLLPMKSLENIPQEHHAEVITILNRCLAVAHKVRGQVNAVTLLERLEFIEEKLKENPNYFVNK